MMRQRMIHVMHHIIPITRWLPHYRLPWLIYDVLAGLTVGIVVVPQSLGFANIVGLPVQYGLYSSFIGVIVYTLFGTSKDISMGPTAVMSLLTAQAVGPLVGSGMGLPDAVVLVSFFTGVFAVAMRVLRMEFLMELISKPVVIGFTSGASLTIMIGQLPKLLGIRGVNTREEAYKIVYETIKRLPQASTGDLAVGLTCWAVLTAVQQFYRRVKGLHPVVRFLCVARNALLIVLITGISYGIHRDRAATYFSLIKTVPHGLPTPKAPSFSLASFQKIALDAFLISLLGMLETIAVGKSLGRKNNYHIDRPQELIAFGMSNLVSSFFAAFPNTGSFSRSIIQSDSRSRSPLPGIVVGVVVIFSLLFLPPAFYYIPEAAIPAIIVSSVVTMFAGWSTWKGLWRVDKADFFTALLGLAGSVLFGISKGMEISVAFNIMMLLYRFSKPKVNRLAPSAFYLDTDVPFVPSEAITYDKDSNIMIFGMKEALLFPNSTQFQQQVMRYIKTNVIPRECEVHSKDQLWCDATPTTMYEFPVNDTSGPRDWVRYVKKEYRKRLQRHRAATLHVCPVTPTSSISPSLPRKESKRFETQVNLDPDIKCEEDGSEDVVDVKKEPMCRMRLFGVVFDFSGINRLDTTSLEMLEELQGWIHAYASPLEDGRDVQIKFAGVDASVWAVLRHLFLGEDGTSRGAFMLMSYEEGVMRGYVTRTVKEAVDMIRQTYPLV